MDGEWDNVPRCDCPAMPKPHRHMQGGPEEMTDEEIAADETPKSQTDTVLANNASEVNATVGAMDDAAALRRLADAEKGGKNRTTVLNAINKRIDDLAEESSD